MSLAAPPVQTPPLPQPQPAQPKLLTVEEFLALPDDGQERWLINGVVWPKEPRMSVRNRRHSQAVIQIGHLLKIWWEGQSQPRGQVHGGDAGFRLQGPTGSLVGADVAYASHELIAQTDEETPYYNGPPVLAVEILSPSDKHEEIVLKVRSYLAAGAVVWVVDPDFQTVHIHRPGAEPETLNRRDALSGEPELPGFRVPVATLFE